MCCTHLSWGQLHVDSRDLCVEEEEEEEAVLIAVRYSREGRLGMRWSPLGPRLSSNLCTVPEAWREALPLRYYRKGECLLDPPFFLKLNG